MKVGPTLDGGLRIDAEDAGDWSILRCIVPDARGLPADLASRLGALVTDEPEAGDWEEFVVPDLREHFDVQLQAVGEAIDEATGGGPGEAGSVMIGRGQAEAWFGALNQARLVIEEQHGFGQAPEEESERSDPQRRSAYFRAQFYTALQGLLLEFVMEP